MLDIFFEEMFSITALEYEFGTISFNQNGATTELKGDKSCGAALNAEQFWRQRT